MSPKEMQVAINQFRQQGTPVAILASIERLKEGMKAYPNLPLKAVADGSGHFTFNDVPPGRYALVVQRDGYFGPSPNGSAQLPQSSITSVVVPDKPTPQTVSASLVPGGVIGGHVRDAIGRPVNNVTVQPFTVEYQ